MPDSVMLSGDGLDADALRRVIGGVQVGLAQDGLEQMARARAVIDAAVRDRKPVYGVTTGLGPRVVDALPEEELETFALHTVRGRAHSAGEDLPEDACRATLAIRLNTFLIGAAGVRPALAEMLAACLNAGLAPAMRGVGSIGAADLMWGGDFGNALIGEGRMWRAGEIVPAAEALAVAGITPWTPGPREGLALVSHSSPSAALAALAVIGSERAFARLQETAALTMEGFRANLSILDPDLLALRPQPGQTEAAEGLTAILSGSELHQPGAARRLQDPLSIRNIPQVHGALFAAIENVRTAVEAEMNGASDNPGVMIDRGEVASHGGYLTPHLALTLGALAQAWSLAAAVQVQRTAKLMSGRFTGLEMGLTSVGAAGAGLGPVMKTAEALWAEIAHEAAPPPIYPSASADGLEDVAVSTGLAGNALRRILGHIRRLTAIELIFAAQAVERRELGDSLAPALRPVMTMVREVSPVFEDDRALGDELEALSAKL